MKASSCARFSAIVRVMERQSREIDKGDFRQALDPKGIGVRYVGLPRPAYVKDGERVWAF